MCPAQAMAVTLAALVVCGAAESITLTHGDASATLDASAGLTRLSSGGRPRPVAWSTAHTQGLQLILQ